MGQVYRVKSRTTGHQFAVKRTRALNEVGQRRFLAELQVWIDMPEHPHVTACRFFRTIGSEVIIFADYVNGGSLKQWIDDGRLYAGGPQIGLTRIMDIAIQFAWGLQAMHNRGLVHQDVKPGNVLLTQDGVAKVTDFGLSKARQAAHGTQTAQESQNIFVSTGGMTPAYCSPEQAKGIGLSHKTDIWSWGLSVLEMFTGGVFWQSGQIGNQALESFLESGPDDDQIPVMPKEMDKLLRRCLCVDIAERWASLGEAVEVLKVIHWRATGCPYDRHMPEFPSGSGQIGAIHNRSILEKSAWKNPHDWLLKAFKASGRDVAEVESRIAPHAGSQRAQAVADLATYGEAQAIFERLMRDGHKGVEPDLAELHVDKAFVHQAANDSPGALVSFEKAIEIRERLVDREGRRELTNDLGLVYMAKACALQEMGKCQAAVDLHDQAIKMLEKMVNQTGLQESTNGLATVYMNRGNALHSLGEHRLAVGSYDRAIEIWRQLGTRKGGQKSIIDLGLVYITKGSVVSVLGDQRMALELYDQAIEIFKRLTKQDSRHEFDPDLARACANKGTTQLRLGNYRSALTLLDQAIEIWEPLVNQEGRLDLANSLAKDYMNKASIVCRLGDDKSAIPWYDHGIMIYERLVNQEGRRELANDLAMAYYGKANAISALNNSRQAVELYDRATIIWERLVKQEGRWEFAREMAMVYCGKANALEVLGDLRKAAVLCQQSVQIYERLVNEEGRQELSGELVGVYKLHATKVFGLRDVSGALSLYDRAILISERLVHHEQQHELLGDLGILLSLRANAHLALGNVPKARLDAKQAVKILQAEVARTGRSDLRAALKMTRKGLKKVL